MKAAQKQQEQLLDRIKAQIAFYDDNLRFEAGGDNMERKTTKQKTEQAINTAALDFLPETERARLTEYALKLNVDPEPSKIHPVLLKHKAAFSAWSKQHPRDKYANWSRDSFRRKPEDEPPFWDSVTQDSLPRMHRFLNPLFKVVEQLGGKVNNDLSMMIRNEQVFLSITEDRDKTPHVLTKDELKQIDKYEHDKKKHYFAYEPKFRKYDYIPNGKLRIGAYGKRYIRDTESSGVEERIGEILIALYLQSEDARIEREKREEEQRKAEEERRQRELQRQKYNDEVDKLQTLTNEAHDYETACRIRAYIAAVETRPHMDAETIEWITWAKAKADWYDPTVSAADPIFGKRNHESDPNDKNPTKKSSFYW